MSSYFPEPATSDLVAEDASEGAFTEAPPLRPTVMVIDDSAAVRTVIHSAFQRVGVQVSAFEDGISAIKALTREEAPVPSVLLLDIGLPRMNGYEVATLLRTHPAFKDTVLIMLTARDGVINRIHSKMVGARGYITKPFRVASVVAAVLEHLNRRVSVGADDAFSSTDEPLR